MSGEQSVFLRARRVFDGDSMHHDAVVRVRDGRIEGVGPDGADTGRNTITDLGDVTLAPGFIDWQVNGGGGVLFNHDPTPETLRRMASAHVRFGTTTMLPTVITDRPDVLNAAADAVAIALAQGIDGIAGLHVEGPNLSPEKPGIHDPALLRPFGADDAARLLRSDTGRVVVTLAPEVTGTSAIRELADRGVIVSLGHTIATYAEAQAAFDAGACAVTHLFNAMAPLHHREPGVVGAAVARDDVFIGLIADGHHVHPAILSWVLSGAAASRCTLVTDAMGTVGADIDRFELNGRLITRRGDRLSAEDGTLAGSHLDMASAVRFVVTRCRVPLERALQMASVVPARLLRLPDRGRLAPGLRADLVALDRDCRVTGCFVGGRRVAPD